VDIRAGDGLDAEGEAVDEDPAQREHAQQQEGEPGATLGGADPAGQVAEVGEDFVGAPDDGTDASVMQSAVHHRLVMARD